MTTIDIAEGRNTAFDMLALLARVADQVQHSQILADAIGEQIDVCLNPSNMAPTLGRLQGFAEVLVQHLNLNGKLSPSQTAEVPHQGVNVPTSGVPKHG